MATPPFKSPAAAERWHRFSAATVRAFHRYGTWLVSLSWWRFGWYSLLLLIATGIIQKLPPFSWTYTETVVDSGRRHSSHPRTRSSPPSPPASVSVPAPPEPPAAPEVPASATTPAIRITKTPASGAAEGKTVDITLPGIVIDTKEKSIHKGGVNITFGDHGIRITTDDDVPARPASAPAPAASSVAEVVAAARASASSARAQAEAVRASAAEIRAAARAEEEKALKSAEAGRAAEAAARAASQVEIEVGGQKIHIAVPEHADADDVKDAINEAKDAIVDQLRDAEQQRRDDAQAAADAAREAADAARAAGADEDGDSDRSTVRTHTVHYGEMLPLLAVWWILGSLLLKITYKGRMQAEVKAAEATETAEAESLRRQVLEARMAMMQAQVEPHFLFNTLASIDHLIEFDPKRASQMQRNLISLLRASMPSMRSTDSGLRPLDLELAVVRPYLEILKVRMEERLTTEIDVPDGLLSAEFPPMMIQTLVENSIKHGLEPKAEGGHLSVKAEIRHGRLAVTVSDTGLGFEAAAQGSTHGTGVGLANIRERLSLLYGTKATLTIANNPVGGTIVTITVPYTAHTDTDTDEGAKA